MSEGMLIRSLWLRRHSHLTPFSLYISNFPISYDFAEIGEPHVFPFHTICYHDILQRCLKQATPGKKIRGDVLFNVLEGLNGGRYVRLQLNYGEPEPLAEQVWCQQKGHEVSFL
jgi:hypothetical protein